MASSVHEYEIRNPKQFLNPIAQMTKTTANVRRLVWVILISHFEFVSYFVLRI